MTRVTRLIHNAGKYLLIYIYPLPTHPTHNFTHKNGGNLDTLPGWPKQLHLNTPARCAGQQYTMTRVQIKIWYQKRHSIPCPRGQAIECLLWVCQNKLPCHAIKGSAVRDNTHLYGLFSSPISAFNIYIYIYINRTSPLLIAELLFRMVSGVDTSQK